MSIDKDFQRHFETKDIPFKKVLEDFKGVLKKEYEKTPLVKDFVKYCECLTDKNTDKEDAHTKWLNTPPGQLPENTLSHDITQTPIYKALQAIQAQLKDFQDKRHYEQDKDYKAHGEANAAMIEKQLNKLPVDLANAIREEILEDAENRYIMCTVIVEWMMGGRNLDPEPLNKRYREAKMYFDLLLSRKNENESATTQYKYTDTELKKICKALKEGGYVSNETTFYNCLKNKATNARVWLKAKTILIYLIKEIRTDGECPYAEYSRLMNIDIKANNWKGRYNEIDEIINLATTA